MASSVAAACSSKLKLRQKRLRSARPHARFTRLPNGACSTSCIPPASSKNRSTTIVCCVGITPRICFEAARYSTIWRAAGSGSPGISRPTHATADWGSASRSEMSWRSRDTASDSSAVRVHDPHLARLDLANEIGGVAELEDVARHALDREVLVERADERVGGLEHHPVVADVGDGPSRRYRRESGAATGPQPAVHPVI